MFTRANDEIRVTSSEVLHHKAEILRVKQRTRDVCKVEAVRTIVRETNKKLANLTDGDLLGSRVRKHSSSAHKLALTDLLEFFTLFVRQRIFPARANLGISLLSLSRMVLVVEEKIIFSIIFHLNTALAADYSIHTQKHGQSQSQQTPQHFLEKKCERKTHTHTHKKKEDTKGEETTRKTRKSVVGFRRMKHSTSSLCGREYV
mmetsp:Transcript_2129/g.6714  ORF Transcript_2129/g.6714 Transcript_2129/m.6714 type:complete len:203 (+) Transcript_2129:554-1162(+)